jgi:hypothetical protein
LPRILPQPAPAIVSARSHARTRHSPNGSAGPTGAKLVGRIRLILSSSGRGRDAEVSVF